MDRRTAIAIALCLLFLLAYPTLVRRAGLGRYMERRPPAPTAVDTSATRDTSAVPAPTAAAVDETTPDTLQAAVGTVPADSLAALTRTWSLETPLYRAVFSNRGARLLTVELASYASAHGASGGRVHRPKPGETAPPGDRVVLSGAPTFGLDLGSGDHLRPLDGMIYQVAESLDASGVAQALTFTGRGPGGLEVRQTWRVRPGDYALDLAVQIANVPAAWRLDDYSLSLRSWQSYTERDIVSDQNSMRASSLVGTNIHRKPANQLVKKPERFDGNAVWAAVQSRYFLAAVAGVQTSARATWAHGEQRPAPKLPPSVGNAKIPETQNVAVNSLIAALPAGGGEHRYVVYAGPSEYLRLSRLHVQLERAVDLGWNWIRPISHLLLVVLNWIYAVVRNYGLAILVLATLVRLLLHPLNMAGIRSMRNMQKLQPELERLKEKYKNDPQAMNTAMMALYRENKVNPAGGCLPMVLQMPIFFALYAVLFNAIELRQAPFVAWVNDLSAPDVLLSVGGFPIRLLPILMAGSGLLLQALTPTAPNQAATAYMMNVMMLVFFYNLPSGLVFYWTVMNALSALQQWLALRHDRVSSAVVVGGTPTPAPAGRKRRSGRR